MTSAADVRRTHAQAEHLAALTGVPAAEIIASWRKGSTLWVLDAVAEHITGPGGADPEVTRFKYVQSVPSDTWTITHNLNFYPVAVVVDSSGSVLTPDVDYVDANVIRLVFSGATAGTAYIAT